MSIHLRKYTASDFPVLKKIFYEAVHAIADRDYSPAQKEVWAPKDAPMDRMRHALGQTIAFVAEYNGVIAGFGNIDKKGYLDFLYVHKDYQGKGIGSALLKKLEEEARALKLPVIETHASITSKPLFGKHEFMVIKEQRVKRGDVELTNYVMVKKLQ